MLEDFQTGLRGLSVVSPAAMELNSVTDRAINRNLETMEQHARGLLGKHDYVPLKCVQQQVNFNFNFKGFHSAEIRNLTLWLEWGRRTI